MFPIHLVRQPLQQLHLKQLTVSWVLSITFTFRHDFWTARKLPALVNILSLLYVYYITYERTTEVDLGFCIELWGLGVFGKCAERSWACSASAQNELSVLDYNGQFAQKSRKYLAQIELRLKVSSILTKFAAKLEGSSYYAFKKISFLCFSVFCYFHQNLRRLCFMKRSLIGECVEVNWA